MKGGGGPFLNLRVAYIPNLHLLKSLEPSEKFVWVVMVMVNILRKVIKSGE